MRGIAYANFPAFFGRAQTAWQCLDLARDHSAFMTVPRRYRALTYAHLAVLSHRRREDETAHILLKRAQEADAQTADHVWTSRSD